MARPPLSGPTLAVIAPAIGVALFLLALGVRACVADARADERRCDRGVCIEVEESEAGLAFRAHNGTLVPIVLRLQPDALENLRADRPPAHRRLDVGERALVLRLGIVDRARPWRHRWSWRFGIGDPRAVPDPRILYDLPFGGSLPRRLTQGVDGAFSHTGEDRYAFDFAMPVGTPVLAAREGTVVWVVDGHERGGPDESLRDQVNVVTVQHADGTLGEYLHLRAGIPVHPGREVEPGDLLAYSGHTGFSTTPHLHFHVARRRADGALETLPIRFAGGPDGFVPRAGDELRPSRRER